MMLSVIFKIFKRKSHDIQEVKTKDEIIAEEIAHIRKHVAFIVQKQIGQLDVPSLESKSLARVRELCQDDDAMKRIKSVLKGIVPLLEIGQTTFIIYSEMMRDTQIASALLQPFGNAVEIMMYVTFILVSDDSRILELIDNHSNTIRPKDRKPIYHWIESLNSESLKSILRDYKVMRNLAAHTYQTISIDAAQSFIHRTYENIQRLELVINPMV